MDDAEIRLKCLDIANGALPRAKDFYDFVIYYQPKKPGDVTLDAATAGKLREVIG